MLHKINWNGYMFNTVSFCLNIMMSDRDPLRSRIQGHDRTQSRSVNLASESMSLNKKVHLIKILYNFSLPLVGQHTKYENF